MATAKELEEFRLALNQLTPAECGFLAACLTGVGLDEALERLEKGE